MHEKREQHVHHSPDIDFNKQVDKLEQAEITMKIEVTEKLKLKLVNKNQTKISFIKNYSDSGNELAENISQILNIYEKSLTFEEKPFFKKRSTCCRRYGHSIAECRQNQQDKQNKPQKKKENQIQNLFTNKCKKIKTYQTKPFKVTKVRENLFQKSTITIDNNHFIEIKFAEYPQTEEIHGAFHKTDIADQIVRTTSIEINIQDQTLLEAISQIVIEIVPIRTQETYSILMIVQESRHTNGIKIFQ